MVRQEECPQLNLLNADKRCDNDFYRLNLFERKLLLFTQKDVLDNIQICHFCVLQVDLEPSGKIHCKIELQWATQEEQSAPRQFKEQVSE